MDAEDVRYMRHWHVGCMDGTRMPRWRGIPLAKSPMDLWAYSEMLWAETPDLVIETGTWWGGSAQWFADMLGVIHEVDMFGVDVPAVVTIDKVLPGDHTLLSWRHGLAAQGGPHICYVEGDSVDPKAIDLVRDVAERPSRWGKRQILVTLDSAHEADHVYAELCAYAPLVSPGSWIVVEDTNTEGPATAVRRWLAEQPSGMWQDDPVPQRFGMTFNPGGFLRRVEMSA